MVITPDKWHDARETLPVNASGLVQLVGWFGSTHAEAQWRKEPEFLSVFHLRQIPGFDPQVDDWDPTYAAIEAEVMASASVIVIRLENNELVNGSLGSVAEIGLALTSAALRGQVVVVSVEDGLLTSLNEPGAIAQYMIIEMFLEQWEKSPEMPGLLHIHRGDNLTGLAEMICDVVEQQQTAAQSLVDFNQFLEKKARRRHNFPLRVVLAGSGGPFSRAHNPTFQQKKQVLLAPYRADGQMVKVLSEGAVAEAWQIPYGSVDHIGVAMATRTLLSIESEYKREADVLLMPLMSEAASKGAATEIGVLLLSALNTGQGVKIYLEPFDPVDYIKHHLGEAANGYARSEKEMRLALKKAGVGDALLATAVQAEVEVAYNLIHQMMQGPQPGFRQVKKSLLGKTPTYAQADNIRRVRALVQAHLEALHHDQRFPEFFEYATKIELEP
ncbi:MAG: hypothetical protein Kow0031_37880 [Anaerolineae bacterium]